ncbi:MAG: hypothetical protein ABI693_10680 [Bryobacteraceae bacterium]
MLSLFPISVLVGVAMLWVFRRTSNRQAIDSAKRRIQACLYEMRLFTEEPSLVWKAQAGLLTGNARYLALMLVPAIAMTVPMVVLFSHLEAFYGMAPLPLGREAVVTIQMKTPIDSAVAAAALQAPPQISVESPAIQVLADRQVTWRIRPTAPVAGVLRITLPDGAAVEKKIDAGAGVRYLAERRVSGLLDYVLHPAESRLPAGNVDWIEIRYPSATVRWLSFDLHWLIWLLIISSITALLLKNRFGVTF